ncbi:MAG TPA: hypothetical protein VGV36_02890 [Solirubrobacteraceae bacterium]|nr:hypothetical protein [Solirubrobacteraceae bacterium]
MSARDRIALSVVAGALMLAGLWFLLLAPTREEAAELGQQVETTQDSLDQARGDLARLRAAEAGYRDNYALLAAIGKAAPAGDDVATVLFQVGATARREKVDFRSFQGAGGDQSAQPQGAGAAAPAQGAAAAAPAQGALSTLPSQPFSFVYEGPFFRLADFLGSLQRYVRLTGERMTVDGRLLRVDGFSLTTDAEGGRAVSATVNATAFTLPEGQSETGGATPAGPAGAQSPGAPTTPTPPPTPAVATGGTP